MKNPMKKEEHITGLEKLLECSRTSFDVGSLYMHIHSNSGQQQ
jgi:hypothetical protein